MKNTQKLDERVYKDMADRMTSPQSVIDSLIQEQLGWKIYKKTRLVEGVGNEVYRISSADGDVILRIHHGEHYGFTHEKWASEQAREKGVPAPNVLSIGKVDFEDKIFSYSFLAILDGTSLSTLLDNNLSQNDVKQYATLAGEMLARIHQVPTDGYGHFRKKSGIGEHKTLVESMTQRPERNVLIRAIKDTPLSISELDAIIETIATIETIEKPHLIHVDYAPKHIFVLDGEITGIIDWEICMSGLAATDFNRWRVQDNRISMGDLIEGYKHIAPLPADFWNNLRTVQLHSALRTLLYHHHVTKSNTDKQKAAIEAKILLARNEPIVV